MRRSLLICAVILCAFPAAAPAAGVKLLECAPALDAQDRTATFEARVGSRSGSERMQVRFTLQVREGALHAWRRVVADGLDEWLTSAADVGRYSYAKTVRNLSAPAAYRMAVRFRWLDADGAVLARSRATSHRCRQPDMRPDLELQRLEVHPADAPERRRYAVTVHNGGQTAAGAFSVALRVGRQELVPLTVGGLLPAERRIVVFTGPACSADAPLLATVDAGGAVAEREEEDDVLFAGCPAVAAARASA